MQEPGCCGNIIVAESTKVNVVLAKVFVNLVRGDQESLTWCMLVWPVVS